MNTSTHDIDGLSHGLNEAGLSDTAPKSNFCSICVKALHYGKLPAAGCIADGDDLDQEHRFIELFKQALSPAGPVGHDGPAAQEDVHLEEGKPDEDPAVLHRKRLDTALLKAALKATNGHIPVTSGDNAKRGIIRLDDIEIKVIESNKAVMPSWFRL